MKSSIFLVAMLSMLYACGNPDGGESSADTGEAEVEEVVIEEPEAVDETEVRKEVEALRTDRDKIAYLREIVNEDQRVRNEEIEANQNYGYNSNEHKRAQQNMMNMDASNLRRIDVFTEVYGAPQNNSVGRMQSEAIWLVVHHSPGTDAHERYYPVLYKAWKNEQVSGTSFAMYLNRWYEKVAGERHMMEGKYTDEDEIKELTGLLNLDPVN